MLAALTMMGLLTASVEEPRELELVWVDPQRLLHGGLLARGRGLMSREVETILETAGVSVRWSRLTPKPRPGAVVVVLTPKSPSAWGLPRDTLGAVMGQDGPVACIYVFFRAVARTLGLSRRPSTTGHFHELGRAVGRIAAHEIVHALAPSVSHGSFGLMQKRLGRGALRQAELRLSRADALAFRRSMAPSTR